MSTDTRKFIIKILDKEYPIESNLSQERLLEVSKYLDEKFSELQKVAPMVPVGRLAILACLNIANELYDTKTAFRKKLDDYDANISAVIAVIDEVISD
ncbi:MAG: cell division protein ZapA [Candidatus Auribacterota bacterium]|nr:cell division protein ZapA [Candidatus Auribacterota bacterium]